eukprot:5745373-Alexandrium_andersonii.AAC.1
MRPEEAAPEVAPAPWLGPLTAAASRDLVIVPLHGAPGLRGDVHVFEGSPARCLPGGPSRGWRPGSSRGAARQ